jgi:hypothetical protein
MQTGHEEAGSRLGVESPSSGQRAFKRGLVVGQAPPGPSERLPPGYQPLQGQPERRLAKLAGLGSPEELWAVFDRIDLIGWCEGKKPRKDYHDVKTGYNKHNHDGHRFPLRLARLAAGRLLHFGNPINSGTPLQEYAVVVLCGRLVAAAFGLRLRASVPWAEELDGVRYLVMPHPSGVSHFWNDAVSRHRAAAAFSAALEAAGLEQPRKMQDARLPPAPRRRAVSRMCAPPTRTRRRWRLGLLVPRGATNPSQPSGIASPTKTKTVMEGRGKNAHAKTIRSRFFKMGHATSPTAPGIAIH